MNAESPRTAMYSPRTEMYSPRTGIYSPRAAMLSRCSPRTAMSPRSGISPRSESLEAGAGHPKVKVPKLRIVPNVIPRREVAEGVWEECGCPKSTANRAQKVDLTPRRHAHMVPLDEALLHYIFDRQTYIRINQLAFEDPRLRQWLSDRCKEGRLFVAKPPTRPPSTKPWRYDSPPKLGLLEPGWRAWDPRDIALTFSAVNSIEEYHEHLETLFLWLNIGGVMKSQMMESGEAWMLACGEETDHLKVKNRRTCKVDRCFVTTDMEFFELIMAKWDRMSYFTRSLKCGEKMKYMRRLMDIRLDPHRSLSSEETRVDICEMGLMIQGHSLCGIHGSQYKLRRPIQTAPTAVHSSKLLSPRVPPKTRAKKLDAVPCTGKRCPFILQDEKYIIH